MKHFFTALIMSFAPPPAHAAELNHDVMIWAMSQAEGGKWGELGGTCCMLEPTWRDRTRLPYEHSRKPNPALSVYREHLKWTEAQLRRNRIEITPETVYLVWRRGLTGAIQRMSAGPITEDAKRVGNLYRDAAW